MKNIISILVLFVLSSCKVGWTAEDERFKAKNCRDAGSGTSCEIGWVKTSSADICSGSVVPIECHNKEEPNKGGNPRPDPSGSGPDEPSEGDPCKPGTRDCPGDLGPSQAGGDPSNEGGSDSPGSGGGALKGTGEVLTHWGQQLGNGWDDLKNELNGNNAENRRKKRETKRLIKEMKSLWAQADAYGEGIDGDRKGMVEGWGLLNDAWKEGGMSEREQSLNAFRGRYNGLANGVLDEVPVPKPDIFDEDPGVGKGSGIYPEAKKIENGRKYIEYARGKLDPNASDYQVRKTLVDVGEGFLNEAERNYRQGNIVEGDVWYEMGMAMADAALSLTPGVGWAKDIYESITGKNLLTGKELTKFERAMAITGALTVGISKLGTLAKAGKMVGIMATTAKTAEEAEKITQAGKEAVDVVQSAGKASGLVESGADSVKAYAEASAKYGKSSGEVADSLKSGKGLFGNAPQIEKSALNDAQAANFKRFEKKLPAGTEAPTVHSVNNGVAFKGEVPGRVPGSKAVYEKVVDSSGESVAYTKTTYAPNGSVVHIKDKIDDSIIMGGD